MRLIKRFEPLAVAFAVLFAAVASFAQSTDEWSLIQEKKQQQTERARVQSQEYAKDRAEEKLPQMLTPEQSARTFTLADGYEATLYASEVDFPIASPVAMTFDDRGRLWVANSPTYPHLLPGELPRDSIVILEDSNRDGRADQAKVFADDLYLPLGIALGNGGVYVAQEPNLVFLRDTNGDDVADEREVLLQGFGTADSHHAIHAFEWGPDGGLYLHEGIFLNSQVETPDGPRRLHDGGVWRYEPARARLQVYSSYRFTNPWGHAFDYWGNDLLCDASSGRNFYMPYLTGKEMPYPVPGKVNDDSYAELAFNIRGRPSSGCDFVSSSAFRDEDQGRWISNQVLGFQGVRWNHFKDKGAGWEAVETKQDLLQSTDPNFRPVGMAFGPDGALYLIDYYNPIIGHMQYSLRDPRRDKSHGRVWRIVAKDRPLRWQPDFAAASVDQLLKLLEDKESRIRFHARRRLQEMPGRQVVPALQRWLAGLDPRSVDYEHHQLEVLWIYQGLEVIKKPLLERLLASEQFDARAGAARVLRFWLPHYVDPLPLLRKLVEDEHPRVRLQGIVMASYIPSAQAAGLALLAAMKPLDPGMETALSHTLKILAPHGQPVLPADIGRRDSNEMMAQLRKAMSVEGLLAGVMTEEVAKELLSRPNLSPVQYDRLLAELMNLRNQTPIDLALGLYAELPDGSPSERQLAVPVALAKTSELAANRGRFEALVRDKSGIRRQVALAAIARLDADVGPALRLAEQAPGGLVDAMKAAPLLEPQLRAGLRLRAQQYLADRSASDIPALSAALGAVDAAQWPRQADLVASFERGEKLYPEYCGVCHQMQGQGIAGAFPPLADSDWVKARNDKLIRIVMNGLSGPLEVKGQKFQSTMAPLGGVLNDQQIADVLTFVRHSWHNVGGSVEAKEVAAVRRKFGGRQDFWTVKELEKVR